MAGAPQPVLRITRRCLIEDLGLTAPQGDLEALARDNAMVAAFLGQRSQNPDGQETVTGLTSKIVAWTLHAGEHRGATWHDKEGGVVWLLASHFHRSGQPDDAYPYFRKLDAQGLLLPDEADFLDLERAQARTLAKALLEEVPTIKRHAHSLPETIYPALLGGRIRLRVLYSPGDVPTLTVAISLQIEPGELELPENWLTVILAAFFPEEALNPPEPQMCIGPWPLRSDEVAYWAIDESG